MNLGLSKSGLILGHVPMISSFIQTGWRNGTNVALRQRRNCFTERLVRTCRG
jgi:hypothetical protein